MNGRSWLKYFGHSNSLYARATRTIINYAPIGEYRLRFFLREEFKCLCSLYQGVTSFMSVEGLMGIGI